MTQNNCHSRTSPCHNALRNLLLLTVAVSCFHPLITRAQGGVPLWTNRYDGPENGFDAPSAIAVDRDGKVFVTGSSTGNGSGYPCATIAYSSSGGVPLWTNYYDGSGNAIAVDNRGNVVVSGNATGSGGDSDYVTIAYSNGGVPLWTNRCNGPGNSDDRVSAIAVDGSGNIFVTGASSITTGIQVHADYETVAYSGAGVPLWTNLYHGPTDFYLEDFATAVAVDKSGNVFVTGYSTGINSDVWDYATIAYSNGGVPLWINRYNDPGNGDDGAEAIAVDGNGNVFVTGRSEPDFYSGFDYVTIKYSGAGMPLWTNRYNGGGNGNDQAHAITVDCSGNVFVTGTSVGDNYSSDYATIAYSSAGVPLWTNRYNGPVDGIYEVNAIAVDANGNVFVTGYSSGDDGASDYATVAYSGAGVPLWTNRYRGSGNSDAEAFAIAVDGSGNVFVAGEENANSYDYVIIKYSSSISAPPHLDFQLQNDHLMLNWTNAGFTLQSAPDLTATFTNVPNATSPFTNPVTAPQQFFRLKGN